jgi:hypothetical protein
VQPPRLATGLVLIPLLAFLLAWQPDLPAAFQGAPDPTTVKKKPVDSKSKGVAAAPGKSTAKTSAKTSAKTTAKTSAKTSAKTTAKASAKTSDKGSANSLAKSSIQKASPGAARKSTVARKRSSKAGSKAASRNVPRQQQPESDRIREIQQALKDHGYPVEASGVWDAATVEALKKFQADQNIDNLSGRGKLDSLTLIALGLGPKREPPPGPSEAPQRSPEGHFP